MTLLQKTAYLRGLCEGLGIDTEKKEGKLLNAVIGILEDMANEIADLEENALALGEEIDKLSDDLADVEELVFDDDDDDDDDDDCECDCDCHHHHHGDDCDCGEMVFEVKCPACNYELLIDEEILASGFIKCPGCNEKLEFDTSFIDDDDDDDDDEPAAKPVD